MEEFRIELEKLINKYSMENGSNTPDFILAEYLTSCLKAYNQALHTRDHWYDKTPPSKLTLEEAAEQLIRLAEIGNYHNECARATLGDLPKIKPEDMVENMTDRTPEERKDILDILLKKVNPNFEPVLSTDHPLELKEIVPQERNTIFFNVNGKTDQPILKLCENGDIFVKGKLTENDKQVTDAMREFLRGQGFVIEPYPDEKRGYPSRRNAELP